MRTGYAIRDRHHHGWFCTRHLPEKGGKPVTIYVQNDEEAMQWKRLKDAKRMLRLLQSESRNPHSICILNPNWKVVC